MKMRLFTGLAIALALGGCSTYGYVGDGGGGYYSGGPSTRYIYEDYGVYGYGGYGAASYYRYNPGWSYGLGYGYPGAYYPYGGGYYRPPYGYSRPPYYYPYPRPPRPDHDGRPGHGGHPGHDGRPDRPPPTAGTQPPPTLDRAPWRDLERLRRGEVGGEYPEGQGPRRPGYRGGDGAGPGPMPGAMTGARPGYNGPRPAPPSGYDVSSGRGPGGSRVVSMDDAPSQRSMQPRVERMERAPQRSAPRASGSRRESPTRTATQDTIEP
jgi:hypothetical protein